MPIAVTAALALVWVVLAFRAFQRGDVVLAGVFLLVGVILTVYRLRSANKG